MRDGRERFLRSIWEVHVSWLQSNRRRLLENRRCAEEGRSGVRKRPVASCPPAFALRLLRTCILLVCRALGRPARISIVLLSPVISARLPRAITSTTTCTLRPHCYPFNYTLHALLRSLALPPFCFLFLSKCSRSRPYPSDGPSAQHTGAQFDNAEVIIVVRTVCI